MVNLKTTALGTVAFFLGYVFTAITSYLIPDLIDAIDMSTSLKVIIWAGLIILWVLSLVVVPAAIKVYGLTDKTTTVQQIPGIAVGVLYGLFAAALAYATWGWTTPMTGVFDTTLNGSSQTLLLATFWIGYIIIWFSDIIIVPYSVITEAKNN